MGRFQWVLGVMWVCLGSVCVCAEVDVKGNVQDVTVYTSGTARVTRVAAIQLPAGKTTVRTAALPARADASSVQVSLMNMKQVLVEAVETRRELLDEKTLEGKRAEHRNALEAQEDKLFEIEQRRTGLGDAIQSRQETLAFLMAMRKQASQTAGREMAVQALNVDSWAAAVAMAETRAETARKQIRELNAELRRVDKERDRERRVHREMQRKMPKEIYETRVYVTFSTKQPVKGNFQLRYNVSGATWEPSYRARADLDKNTLDLDIFGTVQQNSGEDWDNVTLSLSTARPDIGTDAPVLRPWYIRTHSNIDAGLVRKKSFGRHEAELLKGFAGKVVAAPAAPLPSKAVSAGASTVFTAEAKAKIPSDEYRHQIPVYTLTTPIKIEHVAIPKVMQYAFLRATAANKTPFPLLPGVTEVVVGGNYIGRGMMKLTAPGESLKIGLGIDETVKIKLKLLEDKVQRKRRGDRVQTTNVFQITAKNYGKKPVALTIIDQVPVSQSGTVTVTHGSEARRALRGAEFPGQLQWLANIEPGKESAIEFDFTIEYPEAMKRQLQATQQTIQFNNNVIMEKQMKRGQNRFVPKQEMESIQQDMKW